MNLKEVYQKVQNGTASEEELAFIEKEIDKLSMICEIMDNPVSSPAVIEAEARDIARAKKKFNKKTTIRTIVITFISLLLIAVIVCGIIFIPSCTSATKNCLISENECVELAEAFIEKMTDSDRESFFIKEVDKELRIPDGLTNAIFVYEIDFLSAEGVRYQVEVSTKSGYVVLTDIDYH